MLYIILESFCLKINVSMLSFILSHLQSFLSHYHFYILILLNIIPFSIKYVWIYVHTNHIGGYTIGSLLHCDSCIPEDQFLSMISNKRQINTRVFEDHVESNITHKQARQNNKFYQIKPSNLLQRQYSFSPQNNS